MAKELKIWNGRGHGVKFGAYHFYVAAYSVAQAVRIINKGASCHITASEINVYYSKRCWGNSMDGIIPETPCLWANVGNSKPVLLYEEKEMKYPYKGKKNEKA